MTNEELLNLIPEGTGKVYKFLEEIPEGVSPAIHMTIALVEALNNPNVMSSTIKFQDRHDHYIYTHESFDFQDDRFEYLCDMIAPVSIEELSTDPEIDVDTPPQQG